MNKYRKATLDMDRLMDIDRFIDLDLDLGSSKNKKKSAPTKCNKWMGFKVQSLKLDHFLDFLGFSKTWRTQKKSRSLAL
jgi:hypothetical protein